MRRALGRLTASVETWVGKPSRGGPERGALPAALMILALMALSCSSGADGYPLSPVPVRPHGSGASPVVDAREALAAAIDATAGDYRYETTVTVGDAVTTQEEGAVSDGARQAKITTDGRVVEYLQTAYGRWVLGPANRWVVAQEDPGRPVLLDVLAAAPSSAGADIEPDGDLVVDAMYPGDALGVPDVEEVAVEVVISDGLVRHVSYALPSGQSTAEVVTVIRDVGRVGEISAPEFAGGTPTTR